MKLSNEKIIVLANIGALNLNYSSAPASESYKIYKTIKALRKALMDYEDEKNEILKEKINEEDLAKAQAYEKDRTGITEEEYQTIIKPFREAHEQLIKDEVEVDVRPVKPGAWFAIKGDNKSLSYEIDEALEGIFWAEEV